MINHIVIDQSIAEKSCLDWSEGIDSFDSLRLAIIQLMNNEIFEKNHK